MNPNRPLAGRVQQQNVTATYVYFVAGHVKVHPPLSAKLEPYVSPYDMVLELPYRIDSDGRLEQARQKIQHKCQDMLTEQIKLHMIHDVTIRSVSFLHEVVKDGD